jgi:hypothetical protein
MFPIIIRETVSLAKVAYNKLAYHKNKPDDGMSQVYQHYHPGGEWSW